MSLLDPSLRLNPMHILIVSSEPYLIPTVPLGGIFQQHQATALRGNGVRVGVASGGLLPLRDLWSFGGRPRSALDGGIHIARRFAKSMLPLRFRPPHQVDTRNIALLVAAIEQYIGEHGRPDCMHAHNLQYAGLATAEVAQRHKIPFVITEHSSAFLTGSHPSALASRFSQALQASACNIAVSKALADTLNDLFSDVSQLFCVVPNVIEADFVAPVVTASSAPFTFLSIGRLDVNKNHALLLRAFAAAFKGRAVLLRIGGHGQEHEALRTLAQELGIAEQVRFTGFLSREAVAAEMQAAHCFVLPSTKETFGVVVIEAMSFGLPVIATPSGGPSDIVNTANGILTADHSDAAMAAALAHMVANHASYDRTSIAGETAARFSPRAFFEAIDPIYQAAVSRAKETS